MHEPTEANSILTVGLKASVTCHINKSHAKTLFSEASTVYSFLQGDLSKKAAVGFVMGELAPLTPSGLMY